MTTSKRRDPAGAGVVKTLRIPPAMIEQTEALAAAEGTTFTEQVIRALRERIERAARPAGRREGRR